MTIKIPAGIGDTLWLFQKLVSTNKRFDFVIANDIPQRTLPLLKLLPSLVKTVKYAPPKPNIDAFDSGDALRQNITIKHKNWAEIEDKNEVFLACNHHLENGKKLATFLPDLPLNYKIPFDFSAHANKAIEFLCQNTSPLDFLIGIYTSAYSNQRNWNAWDSDQNLEFIETIYRNRKMPVKFIIIGADFDMDLSSDLIQKLEKRKIPHVACIGKPLGEVCVILQLLDYFIGFPSGLSILNTLLEKPTYMWYPTHLEKMQYTWASQEMIETKKYKATQLQSPLETANWILNDYKLFN